MISPRSSVASSLKLGRFAIIGVGAALLAAACTIGTSDENEPNPGHTNSGGQAGEGGDTGGSGGGAATGGSGGSTGGSTGGTETGGQGGEPNTTIDLDCHAGGEVDGTFEALELSDDCFKCAMDQCESEFKACFSQEPYSVCGFDAEGGSDDSEMSCMLTCLDELHTTGVFAANDLDIDDCKAKCASTSCTATDASSVTTDLTACMLGVSGGGTACLFECQYRCIGEGCVAHNNDKAACESDEKCTWTE